MVKAFTAFTASSKASEDEQSDTEHDDDEDVGFGDATGLFETYEVGEAEAVCSVILPVYLRCCTHTLNLVVTTDSEHALNDACYKKLYRQSMAKATSVWNMTSRSTKATDIVGHRFSVPCVTRWNSSCDSVKKLISVDDKKLSEVSKAIGVPPAFLREYLMVMAPVAAALNILQGEQQCALGYILPTISTLKKNSTALI